MSQKKIHPHFDDLDISLYHLVFIGNSIEQTVKAFESVINKTDEWSEKVLYVSTFSLITIQTVSFLDEYHHYLKSTDEELNNIINAIKKAVKPAVDQIDEWKEIRAFRNNVLAHNLRDKKKMITIFERGLSSYDTPKTANDLMVLGNCISMIKKSFESAFKVKLEPLQYYLDQIKTPTTENKFQNDEEAKALVDQILQKINENILKLKMDVELQGD